MLSGTGDVNFSAAKSPFTRLVAILFNNIRFAPQAGVLRMNCHELVMNSSKKCIQSRQRHNPPAPSTLAAPDSMESVICAYEQSRRSSARVAGSLRQARKPSPLARARTNSAATRQVRAGKRAKAGITKRTQASRPEVPIAPSLRPQRNRAPASSGPRPDPSSPSPGVIENCARNVRRLV
jgi:hypothetical protein